MAFAADVHLTGVNIGCRTADRCADRTVPVQADGTLEPALNRSLDDIPGRDEDPLRIRTNCGSDDAVAAQFLAAIGRLTSFRLHRPHNAP
jgi:hypothetical protein